MLIGKLDRKITINEATFTQDAFGENIPTISALASVWAKFDFKGGDAGYDADTFAGTSKAEVVIRYRTDLQISPKHYIEYDSKDWYIRNIREIGRGEGLLLMLEEKTSTTS